MCDWPCRKQWRYLESSCSRCVYEASTDVRTCMAKRTRRDRSRARARYSDAFRALSMHFSGILCMRVFAIPSVTRVARVRCISFAERCPSSRLSLVAIFARDAQTLQTRRNFETNLGQARWPRCRQPFLIIVSNPSWWMKLPALISSRYVYRVAKASFQLSSCRYN